MSLLKLSFVSIVWTAVFRQIDSMNGNAKIRDLSILKVGSAHLLGAGDILGFAKYMQIMQIRKS